MKRLVILQPGYLPWVGFFDLMHKADVFVLLDDVQYTTRDWRSRNRIKTRDGVLWLTVPVLSKGSRNKKIRDVAVDNSHPWRKKHLGSIQHCYKNASHYDEVIELMHRIYSKRYKFLIDINMDFVSLAAEFLGLNTSLVFSSAIPYDGFKDEKLLSICRQLSATHYLSGNAASAYLKEEIFAREQIVVEWHSYRHPVYHQLWTKNSGFISHLSIIDLLFNHGPSSLAIITGKKTIAMKPSITVRHADSFSNPPSKNQHCS